jgi:ABC-type enterochelin transport system substrate-binding protein
MFKEPNCKKVGTNVQKNHQKNLRRYPNKQNNKFQILVEAGKTSAMQPQKRLSKVIVDVF